jgi:two-component system response regulator HydG
MIVTKNILVVDDDANISETMKDILENFGSHVDIAGNGMDAINMIDKKDYDLVLMDVRMPVMGGIEACKKLRNKGSNVNIMFITAAIDTQSSQYIASMDCDVMFKPVDMERLSRVVKKSCHGVAMPRDTKPGSMNIGDFMVDRQIR